MGGAWAAAAAVGGAREGGGSGGGSEGTERLGHELDSFEPAGRVGSERWPAWLGWLGWLWVSAMLTPCCHGGGCLAKDVCAERGRGGCDGVEVPEPSAAGACITWGSASGILDDLCFCSSCWRKASHSFCPGWHGAWQGACHSISATVGVCAGREDFASCSIASHSWSAALPALTGPRAGRCDACCCINPDHSWSAPLEARSAPIPRR